MSLKIGCNLVIEQRHCALRYSGEINIAATFDNDTISLLFLINVQH